MYFIMWLAAFLAVLFGGAYIDKRYAVTNTWCGFALFTCWVLAFIASLMGVIGSGLILFR